MTAIHAYHIIAPDARETARIHGDDVAARNASITSVAQRWQMLRAEGVLRPRRDLQIAVGGADRSGWEDDLAGDDRFVFLSIGPRYQRGDRDGDAAYGWIFDAEEMIRHGGAVLGLYDLAADYDEIIGAVAEIVAATLPRLPEVAEEELDAFMALMGLEDAQMREHLAHQATDPLHDLLGAIERNDIAAPGCATARQMILDRIEDLHAQVRLDGDAALAALPTLKADGTAELLYPGRLPLAWSVGTIEKGREIFLQMEASNQIDHHLVGRA